MVAQAAAKFVSLRLLILPTIELNLDNLIYLIFAAYFLGHLLQGIHNILSKDEFDDFNETESLLLASAKKHFLLHPTTQNIFDHMYLYALEKDKSGHIRTFNNFYSLYRGWFMVSLIEFLFLSTTLLISINIFFHLALLLLSIVLIIVFDRRKIRFSKYFRKKVFTTYQLSKHSYD